MWSEGFVRMYACMNGCMYVCMHVCTYIHTYVCVCVYSVYMYMLIVCMMLHAVIISLSRICLLSLVCSHYDMEKKHLLSLSSQWRSTIR